VKDGCGRDVDSFCDLGSEVSEQLDSEQATGCAVACDGHADGAASGVIRLVIVCLALHGERIESDRGCFGVARARAGDDAVEHLDDLGAEAAGELASPAEPVLARDASLLVRGCAQRKIGLTQQPVMRHDAIAGGEGGRR
jgi:hypothetical protein